MVKALKALLRRITPWYDEEEVQRREFATSTVVRDSHAVRRVAKEELFQSYEAAGHAIGAVRSWRDEEEQDGIH